MSKATKRKHVTKEVLDNFILPNENQQIVRIIAGKGNNLHEVATDDGKNFLVSMPTKFRRNVWIKRGDFVVIQPIEEGEKVKAEIAHILFPEQIRYIQSQNLWPKGFEAPTSSQAEKNSEEEDNESSGSSDNDEDLFVNTNRQLEDEDSEETEESSSDSDE